MPGGYKEDAGSVFAAEEDATGVGDKAKKFFKPLFFFFDSFSFPLEEVVDRNSPAIEEEFVFVEEDEEVEAMDCQTKDKSNDDK